MNYRMKIAITSSSLEHITRGIESSTKNLVYALKYKGIDVTLYKGSDFNSNDRDGNVEKVIPCFKRGSRLNEIIHKIRPNSFWHIGLNTEYDIEQSSFCFFFLFEAIAKQYDIIHTKDPIIANVLNMANKLGLIKSKVIFSNGANEPLEFLKRFDYVQYLSEHHLKEAQLQDINGKKWFAIPNLVDISRFSPDVDSDLRRNMNISEDAFVILCVAALKHKIKRLDYLIKEVSILRENKEKNIFLIIVGSQTGEVSDYIQLGKDILGKNIIFLINQPNKKMPEIYRCADIFVLCSLFETFGLVFIEAMASGLPVIAHRYPVMEGVVGDGGECIDMTKQGALAKTIEKYFDGGLRREISRKAREQVVKNFSKDVVVEQIIGMYREVLGH